MRSSLLALLEGQVALNKAALTEAKTQWRQGDFPLLAYPGWIPDKPFDLSRMQVERINEMYSARETNELRRIAGKKILRPRGFEADSKYSELLLEPGNLNGLFNGKIYRPVGIDFGGDAPRILVVEGRYFDYLDTSEVLALEAQLRSDEGIKRITGGAYCRYLQDPFELRNRVTSLGIDTLTVRLSATGGASFFLHQRDSRKVANNSALISVVPAGEFTPSDVSAEAFDVDLDLWRNIMREYAEEFLGVPDAQGRGGVWIDYDNDPPYRRLNQGRAAGLVNVSVLAVGLDALTWKPELLTVSVITADLFDELFGALVRENDEGLMVIGRGGIGLPFDQATVNRYVQSPDIAPSAKACLSLTWRHREKVGIPDSP